MTCAGIFKYLEADLSMLWCKKTFQGDHLPLKEIFLLLIWGHFKIPRLLQKFNG
jgi:hypothetical protein